MYNPPHFTSTDLNWLDWLAEAHPFGTLVSQVDGAPFASHLPVLYQRTEGQATLTGHWARPNPQWRDIETQRVLFMFQGPHAYISPRWYTDSPKQVPTWNYVAAHVYGTIRLINEGPELEQVVVRLAEKFESGADTPWRFADSDPANRARLKGIVGFELRSAVSAGETETQPESPDGECRRRHCGPARHRLGRSRGSRRADAAGAR